MAYSLHYLDIVKADLIEAKDWYKNQQPGLDKQFTREVSGCISRLQKTRLDMKLSIKTSEPRLPMFFLTPYIFFRSINKSNCHYRHTSSNPQSIIS